MNLTQKIILKTYQLLEGAKSLTFSTDDLDDESKNAYFQMKGIADIAKKDNVGGGRTVHDRANLAMRAIGIVSAIQRNGFASNKELARATKIFRDYQKFIKKHRLKESQ